MTRTSHTGCSDEPPPSPAPRVSARVRVSIDVWRCACGHANVGGGPCRFCGRPAPANVGVRGPGWAPPLPPRASRRPPLVVALAVVLIMVLIGGVVTAAVGGTGGGTSTARHITVSPATTTPGVTSTTPVALDQVVAQV